MVRVSSCCCGCSLKTGTILIGVFYLVFYVVAIVIISLFIVGVSEADPQRTTIKYPGISIQAKDQRITFQENDQRTASQEDDDIPGDFLTSALIKENNRRTFLQGDDLGIDIQRDIIEKALLISKVILGIMLAIVIIGALLNVMLIVGAVQEKARLVFIWFVVHTIILIIDTIMTIVNAISGVNNSTSTGGSVGGTILTILLTIYFLIVVYSYYKELQEKGAPRIPGQPPSFQTQGYSMPPPNQIQGYPMQPPNQMQGYPIQPPNQNQDYPMQPSKAY